MGFNLDSVLQTYSPGCKYRQVRNPQIQAFGGYYFADYTPGPGGEVEPDVSTLISIGQVLESEGKFLEYPQTLEAFIALTSLPIYSKLMNSIEDRPSVMLRATIAMNAIVLALTARTPATLTLAKNAWSAFTSNAALQRAITGVDDQDVLEFNEFAAARDLPMWLRLPVRNQ